MERHSESSGTTPAMSASASLAVCSVDDNRIQVVSGSSPYSDTFSSAISAAFDQQSYRDFLPPDVLIVCSDGGFCEAHRFVLVFQSEFFKSRFRFGVSDTKVEEVDLSGFEMATVDNVKTFLKILYQGEQSIQSICLDQVFSLLYLSNFLLLLPRITDFCSHLLEVQLNRNPADASFVMRVYRVAEELNEKALSALALRHLMLLQEEPEDFETISVDTMLHFLSSPESFGFRCLRSACRMPSLQRERYLLDLVVKFINHDKSARVKVAADLFQRLRLTYIVRDLDLKALGLNVLRSNRRLQKILKTARSAASFPCLWQTAFPLSMYLPRPGSIKYSFFSKRFGSFPIRRATKGAAAADTTPEPTKHRRIAFERDQEHRLTGITVYPCDDGDGHRIIGGIKLRWSDGTEDHAGHYDETCQEEIDLHPYESVLVKVNAGKFIERVVFHNNDWSYGPFGCKDVGGQQSRSPESVLGSLKVYEDFCYLDGLKCCEISRGKDKIITSVRFKLSLMCNLPLEHLMAKDSLEVKAEPTWGLDCLEQPKVVTSSELKRAFKAASHLGYGKLGMITLLPNRA